MKDMRSLLVLSVLLYVWASGLFAQTDSAEVRPGFQLGLGISGFSYVGDFSDDLSDLYRINPGGNLSLQTAGKRALQLQLNAGFGSIAEQIDTRSQGTSADAVPNRFFQTSFFYGDLRLRYHFFNRKRFKPYLALGAGIMIFSPKDENGKKLPLKPETRAPDENYNTVIPQIPAEAGIRARISPVVSASLSYVYRLTPTDYLDNVGVWGSRAGNDQVHQVQLSLYFDFQPQSLPFRQPPPPEPPSDLISYRNPESVVEAPREETSESIVEKELPVEEPVAHTPVSNPENSAGADKVELDMEQIAAEEAAMRENRYIYYEIEANDELESICDRYGVRPETVRRINYLGNRAVQAGMFLRIPDVGVEQNK